ncbi:hypothetical protein D9756_007919 [Leucocoprinus leucothites]|uniref:Transmembrane protein n=1 Tax=Leucocoprinus leucothites TaxID=201217 RepID=A0A8H5D740_9AGAR|nr:hypothetical protein D9756_007919 [Leucoagaricus leucothites]
MASSVKHDIPFGPGPVQHFTQSFSSTLTSTSRPSQPTTISGPPTATLVTMFTTGVLPAPAPSLSRGISRTRDDFTITNHTDTIIPHTSSSSTQPLTPTPLTFTFTISETFTPTSHESTNKIKIIVPLCIIAVFVALGISSIIIFRCRRARVHAPPKSEMGEHTNSELATSGCSHTTDRTDSSQLTPQTGLPKTNSIALVPGLSSNNSTALQSSRPMTLNRLPASKAKRNKSRLHLGQATTSTPQMETNSGSETVAQPSSQESQLERHLLMTLMSRFEALEGRVEAVIGTNPPTSSVAPTSQPLLDLMELEDNRPPDYASQSGSGDNREQSVSESRKEGRS